LHQSNNIKQDDDFSFQIKVLFERRRVSHFSKNIYISSSRWIKDSVVGNLQVNKIFYRKEKLKKKKEKKVV
jgi:hypothetical protein